MKWNSADADIGSNESSGLMGLPNGRLWLFNNGEFSYIGGPKKDDGLWFYKKD
jgi:hypothetical protein